MLSLPHQQFDAQQTYPEGFSHGCHSWWGRTSRKTIIQYTTCIILERATMTYLVQLKFCEDVKSACVHRLKLKHFDICRGGDELHCGTTAWFLISFQHISYYHVAFQKPLLAHPACIKGQGTSCIRNSTLKSSLLTHRYKRTPNMHIHMYAKPHKQTHTPLWECSCVAETSRRAVPQYQQVSGLCGQNSGHRHDSLGDSSGGWQTHV